MPEIKNATLKAEVKELYERLEALGFEQYHKYKESGENAKELEKLEAISEAMADFQRFMVLSE